MISQITPDKRNQILQDSGAALVGIGVGYDIRKYAPKYITNPIFVKLSYKYTKTEEKYTPFIKQKLCELLDKINHGLKERDKIKIKYINKDFKTENNSLKAVKNGVNAIFSQKDKTVYLNEKFITPGFHELAHAKDYVSGLLPRLLTASKYTGKIFGLALPVFAVCTKTKKELPDKKLNNWQKTNNFIRNNIGKLTALAMVPRIIGEFSANNKGTKFAKDAKLPPEVLKAVKNAHRISNASYITGALILALSSAAAVKVKDIIATKD